MASSVHSFDWLLELDHAGSTHRFSRYGAVTYGGHTYAPRIEKLDNVGAIFIDRTLAVDFDDEPSFTLDNLADDWSDNFFFTALNAVDDFEDCDVRLYLYDYGSGTATEMWTGLTKRPKFDPTGKSCTIG